MTQTPINLAARINGNSSRGGPADFSVALKTVSYRENGSFTKIPDRRAVVRGDTGETLAIVSERYTLVPHPRILNAVEDALGTLDVGPVPRGIYVDRRGARMRALFKFPELARPVQGQDTICPCLKIENSYDGTSRITVHIGAFRFVCTNLAVGGGGVFAGGFMAVHQGEIPIEDVAKQLTDYLTGFDAIAALYRRWSERRLEPEPWEEILESLPKRPATTIREKVAKRNGPLLHLDGLQRGHPPGNPRHALLSRRLRSPRAREPRLPGAVPAKQVAVTKPRLPTLGFFLAC